MTARALVRIPTPLRSYTGGAHEVPVNGSTVGEVLRSLTQRHDGLGAMIFGESGQLRPFVNVFVGSRDVRNLDGLETPLADGAILSIIPAVAGGAR